MPPERSSEHKGMMSTLLGIGGSLLLFGAGMQLLMKGQSSIGRAIIRGLPEKTTKAAKSYAKYAGRGIRGAGFFDLIKGSKYVRPYAERYNAAMSGARTSLKKWRAAKGIKEVSMFGVTEGMSKGVSWDNKIEYAKGFLKGRQGRLRSLAAFEEYGRRYVATSGAVYALDRVTRGAMSQPGQDARQAPPPLWNLPATAVDYAKFTAKWLPQDFIMASAMKGLTSGIIGAVAGRTAKRAMVKHAPKVDKWFSRVSTEGFAKGSGLGSVQNFTDGLRKTAHVASSWAKLFNDGRIGNIFGTREFVKGHKTEYKLYNFDRIRKNIAGVGTQMKKLYKAAWNQDFRRRAIRNQGINANKSHEISGRLSSMGDFIKDISEQDLMHPENRDKFIDDMMRFAFNNADSRPKESFAAKVMGWKPAKISDTADPLEFVKKQLASHYKKGTKSALSDNQVKMIAKAASESYIGAGVYRTSAGIQDFSRMNWKTAAKGILDFGINIPGADTLTLGSLSGIRAFLTKRRGTNFSYKINEGEVFRLPVPGRMGTDPQAPSWNFFRVGAGEEYKTAGFVNGQLYALSQTDSTQPWRVWDQKGGFSKVSDPMTQAMNFTAIHEKSGRLMFNQAQLAGDVRAVNRGDNKSGNWFQRIIRKLDIKSEHRLEEPWAKELLWDRPTTALFKTKAEKLQKGFAALDASGTHGNAFSYYLEAMRRGDDVDYRDVFSLIKNFEGYANHIETEAYGVLKRNMEVVNKRYKNNLPANYRKAIEDLYANFDNENELLNWAVSRINQSKVTKTGAKSIGDVIMDVSNDRTYALHKHSYSKASFKNDGMDELRKFYLYSKNGDPLDSGDAMQRLGKMLKADGYIGADEEAYMEALGVMGQYRSRMEYVDTEVQKLHNFILGKRRKGTYPAETETMELLKVLGEDHLDSLDRLSTAINSRGKYITENPTNYLKAQGRSPFIVVAQDQPLINPHAVNDLKEWWKSGDALKRLGNPFTGDANTFLDNIINPHSGAALGSMFISTRFPALFEKMTGIGFDRSRFRTPGGVFDHIFRRFAQIGTVGALFATADAFTDENPMFEHTMLDEGVKVAIGEQVAKVRLGAAKALGVTGVTKAAQYTEGLMPGSSSFIPGAVIGGMMSKGPGGMLSGAIVGGFINKWLTNSMGLPDLTESYEELQDIYGGQQKVPVRKGRGFILGRTPMEGGRIERFGPGWFHRLKSQPQYTPDAWGGKWEALLHKPWPVLDYNPSWAIPFLGDPYHYERKHYFTRPYPESGEAFGELPIFAAGANAFTLAGSAFVKPTREMHRELMDETMDSDIGGDLYSESDQVGAASSAGIRTPNFLPGPESYSNMDPVSMQSGRQKISETMYRGMVEPFGLPGFLLQTAMGGAVPFSDDTVLAQAGKMTSMRRAYWDKQLGDFPLGYGELIRRMLPAERSQLDEFNPLRNKMATWLPGGDYMEDYRHGDAYAKITAGEERLPGTPYESLYDVEHTFPGRSSQIGKPISDQIAYFLGTEEPFAVETEEILEKGTAMHEYIQDILTSQGVAMEVEKQLYDPWKDISGHVDVAVRGHIIGANSKAAPLEIKTINDRGFSKLRYPKFQHKSQINEYMRQMKADKGALLYVNREDPSKTKMFKVNYSPRLAQQNLRRLDAARSVATQAFASGYGYHGGQSYSRMDRFKILADVGRYSEEYKETKKQVEAQMRAGMLDEAQQEEFGTVLEEREATMRKYDMYPYRFAGNLLSPSESYDNLSQNKHILPASEYSLPERLVGYAWEKFSHADTPVHTKLMQYRSPMEQYYKRVVEGQDFAGWDNPVQNFFKPYMRTLVGSTGPVEGMLSGAMGGYLAGGSFGAMAGGAAMGAYGTLHGLYRHATNSSYIPGYIKKEREIDRYFDRLEYQKMSRMYATTGDVKFKQKMMETAFGADPLDTSKEGFTAKFRAMPYSEKSFYTAFKNVQDPDQQKKISKLVSPEMDKFLKNDWGSIRGGDYSTATEKSEELTDYFKSHHMPSAGWEGWSPNVQMDDIKLKTYQMEGLDAHRAGLGWYDQERRIRNSPDLPGPIDINERTGTDPVLGTNSHHIREAVYKVLHGYGLRNTTVSVTTVPTGQTDAEVNLSVNYDMTSPVKDELDFNSKVRI